MGRLTREEQKRRDELLAKGLKVCSKCGRELPVEQFSKCKSTKDGFNSICKECAKQYMQQYYQETKEERLQYQKQYRQEHKEEKQQYMQQYRQENKEKIRQYQKQYQPQHYQQYIQTPQGQIAYFNVYGKRRKREEAQGAGINKDQWLEMMHFFDWKCAYSGILVSTKNNRSIDHIVPLAKGGEHEIWNCVPMYKPYNISKQDKDLEEWYTAQDFYSKERLDKILAWQEYAYNKWSNTEEAQ